MLKHHLREMIEGSPNKRISYHDYMDAVLYAPNIGYYVKQKKKIGTKGDFYTSGNVGDAFGRSLARWFVHLIKVCGVSPRIVEIGAGDGKLAYDILVCIKETEPLIWDSLTYVLVETSPYHKRSQVDRIGMFKQVSFATEAEEWTSINGIVFSNEFFDALPVHVIEKNDGALVEVFVTVKNGRLLEVKEPLTNRNILSYLTELSVTLHDKQRYEIPLKMVKVYEKIASSIRLGVLLTIDYGYTQDEWKEPALCQGSLRGYYQHEMIKDALVYPGDMDLTTHIHFDTLMDRGEKIGLACGGLYQQHEFLLKTGILEELKEHQDTDPFSKTAKRNRAIRGLIVPGGFSEHFKVLLQTKNLAGTVKIFPD
ncbi:SAM-dependent methyltransferase [Peribacillus muralis]|uniref:class I SAM-dependent methyltransferase n=1 Tax=Peribacillus muralis TaxID=264697 RepID=UPI001F4D9252|nr:SAM-dependent methyltransferase [Peribacillus muralis]MCK1991494.1 SAM-dependent methyltransferase [Peribacillus muralis]MCK2012053.1 SAM-dependent methyltransferase [Peribacillus muralis]